VEVLGKKFCGFEGAEDLVLKGHGRGQCDAILGCMNRFEEQGNTQIARDSSLEGRQRAFWFSEVDPMGTAGSKA
jgi:hypothetical protein